MAPPNAMLQDVPSDIYRLRCPIASLPLLPVAAIASRLTGKYLGMRHECTNLSVNFGLKGRYN